MTHKKSGLFQYILIIKKEDARKIDYISFLLCFIPWIFFLYYTTVHGIFSSILFGVSWLIPAALARTVWLKKKVNKATTFKHPLFVTGCVWLFVPGMRWVALLFILFILFDHQSRQPLEIGVSDEEIVINTFFRKRYEWNALSNLVLKDNLITLDFKNNKILQKEIMRQDIHEEEFNNFCQEQLDLR